MSEIVHGGTARVVGGREGRATSGDGILDVPLAPPVLAQPGAGTTPEALFAAAFGACFSSAIGAIRRQRGLRSSTIESNCTVDLAKDDAGGYGLVVDLAITIPETSDEDAIDQVRAADLLCPYSVAIRGNVPVTLHANGHLVS